MSFKINGETWRPKTTVEHADKIIDGVNALLQQNGIKDKNGKIIQLKKSYDNALYLLALGDGNRFADNDEKLSRAINSLNIELCDDAQIENLLPIAAVARNPGSYSTLRLTVQASSDGDCIIPAGTKAPYENVNFIVKEKAVISAGSTQIIDTVCDTIGAVAVLSGEIKSFDRHIINLESVENLESSIPGTEAETTNALRRRLVLGDTIKYSLDGCKGALESLTGVSYARIFFNYNTKTAITLTGGVVLQPRTAYIVIHGNSDKIAETYAGYMSAPTQNSPIAKGTYSTVGITIGAASTGNAVIPSGTTVVYKGHTFKSSEQVTITAGTEKKITFTCTEVGAVQVPQAGINELVETIDNVISVINREPSISGMDNPAKVQNWTTASGQSIPIHYDLAGEKQVFVKVWLTEDADNGTHIRNQIKRDLILASANWRIGDSVTQLLTSAPFVHCTYTEVAYTQVSIDGKKWESVVEVDCNTIPRISDATITIEQVGA